MQHNEKSEIQSLIYDRQLKHFRRILLTTALKQPNRTAVQILAETVLISKFS